MHTWVMPRQALDLFNDPPWPTELPADQPAVRTPRPWLVILLALVVVLVSSLWLSWFIGGEGSGLSPLSNLLDRGWNTGWSPGTQNWGLIILGLAAVVSVVGALAIRSPTVRATAVLLLSTTVLLVVTLLETSSDPSFAPGPYFHADRGAWVGSVAVVLAWVAAMRALRVATRSRLSSEWSRSS